MKKGTSLMINTNLAYAGRFYSPASGNQMVKGVLSATSKRNQLLVTNC